MECFFSLPPEPTNASTAAESHCEVQGTSTCTGVSAEIPQVAHGPVGITRVCYLLQAIPVSQSRAPAALLSCGECTSLCHMGTVCISVSPITALFSFLFFSFCGARDCTQGPEYSR